MCEDFLGKILKPPTPTNKDLAFASFGTVPFSLYDDIYSTLLRQSARSQNRKPNLRSHDLNISGKKTSKCKSEENISHLKKTPVILAW